MNQAKIMFLSKLSSKYNLNILFIPILIMCFTISEQNDYIIGYNRGYDDAWLGSVDEFGHEVQHTRSNSRHRDLDGVNFDGIN